MDEMDDTETPTEWRELQKRWRAIQPLDRRKAPATPRSQRTCLQPGLGNVKSARLRVKSPATMTAVAGFLWRRARMGSALA